MGYRLPGMLAALRLASGDRSTIGHGTRPDARPRATARRTSAPARAVGLGLLSALLLLWCSNVAVAQSTPYLERLEVVATNAVADDANGGNGWARHKSRIVRTPDGNLYAAYVCCDGQTDIASREWRLMKRQSNGTWTQVGGAVSGREPANVLTGPNSEIYVIAWPGGLPKLWTTTNGGQSWTSQSIPGHWTQTQYPYSGAAITPAGMIYTIQSVGGTANCCDKPGYFNIARYDPAANAWTFKTTTMNVRETYAYLLPTDSGSLQVVAAQSGLWSTFGYVQPPGAFTYVWNSVRFWQTSSFMTSAMNEVNVAQVQQTNGDMIEAFQADAYRDSLDRTHILYDVRSAATGGELQGRQAILQNGAVVKDVEVPGVWCPNMARKTQDLSQKFWMVSSCGQGELYVYDADANDGTTYPPAIQVPVPGYQVDGHIQIASPRGGSANRDYVDAVFAGASSKVFTYFRLRLKPAVADAVAPTVAITSPANNTTVARKTTIVVAASATDNVVVSRVEFSKNGALMCTDTVAPYTCSMFTHNNANVKLTLQAKAYDDDGNSAVSTVAVTTR